MTEAVTQGTPTATGKTRWLTIERALAIAAAFSPLTIAVIAGMFARGAAERNTHVELLKLSVGILQAPVSATDTSQRALRTWGVRLLAKYSDVDLPQELQKALTDSIRLPATAETPVELTPEAVAGVSCVLSSSALAQGQTTQSAAVATDQFGNLITGRRVRWASASPSVATVTPKGVITAVGPGTTEIRATVDGKTSGCATIVVKKGKESSP